MTRIEQICSFIEKSSTFADIGCDHGYCTQAVLKSGKCGSAIISDVSEKSLEKAERLLADYIGNGVVRSVCCDGLAGIPEETEQILIAGMGGMEIIKILTEGFIPRRFVFQPMKNADRLRSFLIEKGCRLVRDDIFFDGNYYFIIKGERDGGTTGYTPLHIQFGRDSLKNPLFGNYAREELSKKTGYLGGVKAGSNADSIRREIRFLREALGC